MWKHNESKTTQSFSEQWLALRIGMVKFILGKIGHV